MNIKDFSKDFADRLQEIQEWAQGEKLKKTVGEEAVDHYKQGFYDGGFTDSVLNPWKEVERRKPDSPWYGHSGQLRKYSPERTTANILEGEKAELREAITFKYLPNGVRIVNEKPYAAVHQYGLPAKIYGKKPFKMPARPFIGRSKVMIRKINEKITREFLEILRK